jgi:DNA ligase 1
MRVKLYTKDNAGSIRVWEIYSDANIIVMEYGQLGGRMQIKEEIVEEGKAGRTLSEQIMLQMASRISRQRDKGYRTTIEEVKDGISNQLNLPKPMLAQRFDKVKNVDYSGAIVQMKYDGNRCIITKQNNEFICYSRNGKIIAADLSHITNEIALPEGWFLDGELYCHGEKLQTIVSWIKKDQDKTKNLKFHGYDIINDDPYKARAYDLGILLNGNVNSEFVPTFKVDGPDAAERIHTLHKQFVEDGYEGTIIRVGESGYETGKRSKSLIKLKSFLDAEFTVVGIAPSKDGWARLECILPNEETFKVSAPGTMEEKHYIMDNYLNYIGRKVNVEFAYYTNAKKPFHPVATAFRNPLEE